MPAGLSTINIPLKFFVIQGNLDLIFLGQICNIRFYFSQA
jgi:hypothetical protein